jgi:hypothetical protein
MRKVIRGKLAKIIGVRNPERIINVVTGKKGSGKTAQTKKILKKYARRFPKEKILILDTNNEYNEYKEIQPKQIKTFRKPSRIILSKHKLSDVLSWLCNFRGGLLVVESSGMLIEHKDSLLLYGLLSVPRTKDYDVIFIGQSIESIQPKIYMNTSVFRFHSSMEKPTDRIHPYAKVAQEALNTSVFFPLTKRSRYKFCYYDVINQKILGVGLTDLYVACYSYYRPKIESLAKELSSYGKVK